MKRHMVTSILIASMILGTWLPLEIKAEENIEDGKSGKAELKKLYELTLPECITAYSIKKGKDGKNEIDKVLTIAGIYEVEENKQVKQLQKRIQELPDKTRCYPSSESFSPDGRYVVLDNNPGEYPGNFIIHDFENRKSSPIDVAIFGAFSNRSMMFFARQVPSLMTDFSGNKIAELPEMVTIKGFENGFICKGDSPAFYFVDGDGHIIAERKHRSPGIAYDIDQRTGETGIIIPSESKLMVYDYAGNFKHGFNLPFSGYSVGIGVSDGGEYAAVISSNGWIKLFDFLNKKELWTKNFVWGGCFSSSSSPVPVSENGKYIIGYGDLKISENPTWSMIVLNKEGICIGQIEPPVPRNLISYYHIDFIPGTNTIAGFTDSTLSVFEIVEGEVNFFTSDIGSFIISS